MSRIQLRDYQERFINAIRAEFEEHQAVMGVAPTGFGKTICFSYIADCAATLGNRTFILLHRKQLVRQTSRSLAKNGIPHGVLAAGYPEQDFPIQVCSVQTLARRIQKPGFRFAPPDLIVTDEGHHVVAPTYNPVVEWAQDALHLAVTATPVRMDGRGFEQYFTSMVCGDDVATLISNGWLSKPVLYAPPIDDIDLSNVHITAGDFNRGELAAAMNKKTITGSAVEHYKRLLPHYPPTLVFCVSVEHARDVAREFCESGIPAAYVDGSMTDDEIQFQVIRLAKGEIRCLMSCDLISEGFDLSATAEMDVAIACVILLRPTESLALHIQQIGRALRPATGKAETLVIDHVENWKRHGLIDDPRDWTLEGRKKRGKSKRGESLTRCPKCFMAFPPVPVCPGCGFQFKVQAAGSGREIEQVDGTLVRIDSETARAYRKAPPIQITPIRKLERA